MTTELPLIGETIDSARAHVLCMHFGLTDLAYRIDGHATAYHAWIFDGASMVPDRLISWCCHIPHLTEICLQHDLKYAYGELGNTTERLQADTDLYQALLKDGASRYMAWTVFWIVRACGDGPIKTKFSWGFARNRIASTPAAMTHLGEK